MAYKINGTTVVDNSRNVTACCVTSCCITASTRMDVPSGNTASRPGSPATGSIYFDTDETSLVAYNGSDWGKVGGSSGLEYTDQVSAGESWTIATVGMETRCRGECPNKIWCCSSTTLLVDTENWKTLNPMVRMQGCGSYPVLLNNTCCFQQRYYVKPGSANVSSPMKFCMPIPTGNICTDGHCGKKWTGNVFPDGSYCSSQGTLCTSPTCLQVWNLRSVLINSKGGVSFNDNSYNAACVCSACCVSLGLKDFTPVHYVGSGRNGPIAFTGYHQYCSCGPFEDVGRRSSTGLAAWTCKKHAFEVDTSTFGQNSYKVCCFTNFTQCNSASCKQHPRVVQIKQVCLYSGMRLCCIVFYSNPNCKPATHLTMHCCWRQICADVGGFECGTFISKTPTFSALNPTHYTKLLATDSATGVNLRSSVCELYNSIFYARNACDCYNCGRPEPINKGVLKTSGYSTISDDGCFMYHWYEDTVAANNGKFCCGSSPCACVTHATARSPGIEKINLTTGQVLCSVYYCGFYDCGAGNTNYPYISNYFGLREWACAWYNNYNSNQDIGGGSNDQLMGASSDVTLDSTACVIRPCDCSTHFYQLGGRPGKGQYALFNENTLNFEWFNTGCQNNQNCARADCAAQAYVLAMKGCCSSDARFPCLCQKMIDYIADKGCTNRGWWHNTLFDMTCFMSCCSTCNFCTDGMPKLCMLPGNLNNSRISYINPYTNHLVCLAAIYSCPLTVPCLFWVGMICIDLRNDFCVSAVDTIWPNSGDECMFALCCSLSSYCQGTSAANTWQGSGGADLLNYNCRPISQCGYINARCIPCLLQFCCCSIVTMKTYSNEEKTAAGTVFRLGDCLMSDNGHYLRSSCQYCSACVLSSNFGYFGSWCKGRCVANNTCNGCQAGLCAKMESAITNVPFCKPLCCSQLFSRNPKHKDMIEFMMGCHCLAKWFDAIFHRSCNFATADACNTKMRCEYVNPCLHNKVDITCQYSHGCTGVYTWGNSQWCSQARWVIADMATTTFCFQSCTNQSTNCLCSTSPVCFCTFTNANPFVTPMTIKQLYECDMFNCGLLRHCCYGCDLALYETYNGRKNCFTNGQNIVDNMSDAFFGGCAYHSDYFPMGKTDRTIIVPNSTYTQVESTTVSNPMNCGPKSFLAPTSTTCTKGAAGLLIEWFNRDYAQIC